MAMTYSLNFAVNKESPYGRATKQNNQFLSVVDLYSLDPTNLKVVISSANFGEGNYPDLAKHRWIIRTHYGFYVKFNFESIDTEVDRDTISVYKLRVNADKELVDQVTVAKNLLVKCNQAEIVFRADCSVNTSGFQATVQIIKSNDQTEKTTTKAISTKTNSKKITTKILTTQKAIPEIPTTQNITPEIPTARTTTTVVSSAQNITTEISTTRARTSEISSTRTTTPKIQTTRTTTLEIPTTSQTQENGL